MGLEIIDKLVFEKKDTLLDRFPFTVRGGGGGGEKGEGLQIALALALALARERKKEIEIMRELLVKERDLLEGGLQ